MLDADSRHALESSRFFVEFAAHNAVLDYEKSELLRAQVQTYSPRFDGKDGRAVELREGNRVLRHRAQDAGPALSEGALEGPLPP